ncbi:MAG TPA: tetratricopeptide repeat protein [Pirellulales bacterium]|jgi:putative thioredoxin|nr:tetratricopeptide repeat protein [Pirellulales bacterium]
MSESIEKLPWVIDADEASFEREAVERSRELLVVVDFWAAWCQPCRLLGPILEKLAGEYAGKFLLVKADVDRVPNLSGTFGVQSIPAVYGLKDGQIVDFFVGLKSDDQARAWIDRLLPSEAESLVAQGRQLEATNAAAAEAIYRRAIELDANLASAKIALAELLLAHNRDEECRSLVDELEARGFLEPEAEKLKARLHLSASARAPADLDALRAAAAQADDLSARLKLAAALAADGQHEEALATALAVVERHHKEFVDPARQLMVDIFRLLGDDSPLTTNYRRRLSTALY